MTHSSTFSATIAALSGVIVVGVLTAVPVSPAVAAEASQEFPRSQGNENTSDGKSSALGAALAKARSSKKPVEVVAERDAMTAVTANPDGTVTEERAQTPIHAKDADGDWVDIDPTLTERDGRLEPTAAGHDVSFSKDGSGPLAQLALGKKRNVAVTYLGDLEPASTEGGVATYDAKAAADPEAAPAEQKSEEPTTPGTAETDGPEESPVAPDAAQAPASVTAAVTGLGFSSHVVLDQAPTSAPVYRYRIDTTGVDVRLEGQMLSFLDGTSWWLSRGRCACGMPRPTRPAIPPSASTSTPS